MVKNKEFSYKGNGGRDAINGELSKKNYVCRRRAVGYLDTSRRGGDGMMLGDEVFQRPLVASRS